VQNKNGSIWIAAHTNKNWYGLKREIESALSETKINIPNDQIQGERMDKEGV
jgi:cytochrome c biogenesis protein